MQKIGNKDIYKCGCYRQGIANFKVVFSTSLTFEILHEVSEEMIKIYILSKTVPIILKLVEQETGH